MKLGDITKAFPFNVVFRDSHPTQSLDRYLDYGIICNPSTNTINSTFGGTVLTPSVTLGNNQIWRVDWDLKGAGMTQYSITPSYIIEWC